MERNKGNQSRPDEQPVKSSKASAHKNKPARKSKSEAIFGCLKGEVQICGDIVSPTVSPEEWDVYALISPDHP